MKNQRLVQKKDQYSTICFGCIQKNKDAIDVLCITKKEGGWLEKNAALLYPLYKNPWKA